MHWDTLRKTSVIVHVEYGHAHTSLFSENIAVRTGEPFDFSIDLNKNLRTRHKSVGTYVAADDLANGDISRLKAVQIHDKNVLDRIGSKLEHMETVPRAFRLHVALKGSHWFNVRPELRLIRFSGRLP